MNLIRINELPFEGMSHALVGEDHAAPISIYFVEAPAGKGPVLHLHPYVETLVVLEGTARLTVGSDELSLEAGQVAVVPANTPHRFINTGSGLLRQIDIHASSRFVQTDLG
jgi:mannose-6-phosphate isomerase-like protein (cupin superfamily)